MNLYAKLPENDIAHITDYIEAYAGIDGDGISMKADLDYILRFWDKNKEDLFKIFGGKFILTKSISYTKPLDILEEEMNRVIRWDGPGRQFYEQFQQFVEQFENDTKWTDAMMFVQSSRPPSPTSMTATSTCCSAK